MEVYRKNLPVSEKKYLVFIGYSDEGGVPLADLVGEMTLQEAYIAITNDGRNGEIAIIQDGNLAEHGTYYTQETFSETGRLTRKGFAFDDKTVAVIEEDTTPNSISYADIEQILKSCITHEGGIFKGITFATPGAFYPRFYATIELGDDTFKVIFEHKLLIESPQQIRAKLETGVINRFTDYRAWVARGKPDIKVTGMVSW